MKINGLTIEPGVDLRGADLRGADLQWANLFKVRLCCANLQGADLRGVDLFDVDLQDANLQDADLRGASLRYVKLQDANLQDADLRSADLRSADLRGAKLQGADLCDANLRGANLRGAQLPDFQLPRRRHIVGWKKVCDNIILRLRITGKRTATLTSNKCRADKVVVEAAFTMNGTPAKGSKFSSIHDKNFIYTVGQEVLEPNYDPDPRVECTQGIHFFRTQKEAVDWYWY